MHIIYMYMILYCTIQHIIWNHISRPCISISQAEDMLKYKHDSEMPEVFCCAKQYYRSFKLLVYVKLLIHSINFHFDGFPY